MMDSSRIELIVVPEQGMVPSLQNLLEGENFNWSVTTDNYSFSRINRVDDVDSFKCLVEKVEQFSLKLVFLVGADDRSYAQYLKHMPKHSKVLVYLDNKKLVHRLLVNPSIELFNSWAHIALDNNQLTREQFEFSVEKINSSVRKEFSRWLTQVKEKDSITKNLSRLSKSDFIAISDREYVHKINPMISFENDRWYGTPSPDIGFWSNVSRFETIGTFRLLAAAGQELKSWFDNVLVAPNYQIKLTKPKKDEGTLPVEFTPVDDSEASKERFKKAFKPYYDRLEDFETKLKVCIRLDEEILVESLPGEFEIDDDLLWAGGEFKIIYTPPSEEIGNLEFSVDIQYLE